jgi:nucleoside-diphosphate-sugar epimerase
MRLFVTGASGFIGSAVVTELRAAGHQVIGLARSDASADRLRALGAEVVSGFLTDLETLRSAAAGSDGVIHLAYDHDGPYQQAADSDRMAIEVLGEALAGTDRPLVVTSGTLVLPTGRVGTEADTPDGAAPAAARAGGEHTALMFTDRGVRVSVVRLAPCVHERVKRGFVGGLIDAAERTGFAGYLGDGSQRWPALHRQDAATLYRLATERAPAGSVLHGVGEEGVTLRAIAELIADRLDLPVRRVAADQAANHFGWLATLAGVDAPASSIATRTLLDWEPTHAGLLDDLAHGDFFADVPHTQTPQGRPR